MTLEFLSVTLICLVWNTMKMYWLIWNYFSTFQAQSFDLSYHGAWDFAEKMIRFVYHPKRVLTMAFCSFMGTLITTNKSWFKLRQLLKRVFPLCLFTFSAVNSFDDILVVNFYVLRRQVQLPFKNSQFLSVLFRAELNRGVMPHYVTIPSGRSLHLLLITVLTFLNKKMSFQTAAHFSNLHKGWSIVFFADRTFLLANTSWIWSKLLSDYNWPSLIAFLSRRISQFSVSACK